MAKQQKFKIKIPSGYYSKARRQEIAEDIVTEIKKRTLKGKDKNDDRFAAYDKEYAKEKGQRRVDLVMSEDMLDNLTVLEVGTTNITIGYEKGYDGMGKVEGNILGTYGQKTPIAGKARDFLGISQPLLEKVLRRYPFTPSEKRAQELSDSLDRDVATLSPRAKERLYRSRAARAQFQEELRDKNDG